eukprot:CAMPEP_0198256876 /NCGR_PEP_ID=MMETSP1447-20131203/6684_1 /TAXON_ID=420782 /ORGANISM="Chaetoceros dichaeta, Strain CCMP1751" /LENGTH=198 /DNA_ID=CAMNT_0043943625 /DNA_START=1 /DNA_END=597 /DNA_ORIENTATION=-
MIASVYFCCEMFEGKDFTMRQLQMSPRARSNIRSNKQFQKPSQHVITQPVVTHPVITQPNEKCKSVPQTTYQGLSNLIDVNGSGELPTQGDVSIANTLTPINSDFPSIKAICTITSNYPSILPPFCTLETTLVEGGKLIAMGTPPSLAIVGGTGEYSNVSGMITTNQTFTRGVDGSISFGALIEYCILGKERQTLNNE